MREFRPMSTTPEAMKHIEKNEGRLLEERKISQTVLLPPKAERVGVRVNAYPCQPRTEEAG